MADLVEARGREGAVKVVEKALCVSGKPFPLPKSLNKSSCSLTRPSFRHGTGKPHITLSAVLVSA